VFAGSFTTEPNTLRLGPVSVEIVRSAGIPVQRAGWVVFSLLYYVLGHCIEEQAQAELAPQGGWEAKAHEHDGSDFDQVVTATIGADPADRFAYGLQLLIDGIRAQLAG
jgi:tetracycline repressor-like protein